MVKLNVLARGVPLGKQSSHAGDSETAAKQPPPPPPPPLSPTGPKTRTATGNIAGKDGRTMGNTNGGHGGNRTGSVAEQVALSSHLYHPAVSIDDETTPQQQQQQQQPPTPPRRRSFNTRILTTQTQSNQPNETTPTETAAEGQRGSSSLSPDGTTETLSAVFNPVPTSDSGGNSHSESPSVDSSPPPPHQGSPGISTRNGGAAAAVAGRMMLPPGGTASSSPPVATRRTSSSFIPRRPGVPKPRGGETPGGTANGGCGGGGGGGTCGGPDTSVSIESLHRHRSSGASSSSAAGANEIRLNFDRLRSRLFGRDEARMQLWEAFLRACHPPEEGRHRQQLKLHQQQQQQDDDDDVQKPAVDPIVGSASTSFASGKTSRSRSATTVAKSSSSSRRSKARVEVVFVHGPSGVGKGRLVEDFHSRVLQQTDRQKQQYSIAAACAVAPAMANPNNSNSNWNMNRPTSTRQSPLDHVQQVYFLQSKFPQQLPSSVPEPFSAFSHALVQLGSKLAEEGDPEDGCGRDTIRQIVLDGLAVQDIRSLVKLCPELKCVLLARDEDGSPQEVLTANHKQHVAGTMGSQIDDKDHVYDDAHTSGSFLRNSYARAEIGLLFLRLMRLVGRPSHPIVLFLDDVQWADPDSLDLISTLVHEGGCRHFMLIVAFREDRSNGQHSDTDHRQETPTPTADVVASAEKVSVYSIISRKSTNSTNSKTVGAASVARPTASTSMSLARAPKWSSARTRSNFLLFGHNSAGRFDVDTHRQRKPKINAGNNSRNVRADKTGDKDANIAPPPTFLRKAITLGTYNPSKYLHTLNKNPPNLSPIEFTKPTHRPILESTTIQDKPLRSSLIDGDTDEEDEAIALFRSIPMVPRPIPFSQPMSSGLNSCSAPTTLSSHHRPASSELSTLGMRSEVRTQESSPSSQNANCSPSCESGTIPPLPLPSSPTSSTLPRIGTPNTFPENSPKSAKRLVAHTSNKKLIDETTAARQSLPLSGNSRLEFSAEAPQTHSNSLTIDRNISPASSIRKMINNRSQRFSRPSSDRKTNGLPSVNESLANATGSSLESSICGSTSNLSMRIGRPSVLSELTSRPVEMSESSLLDFPPYNSRHASEEFLVGRYANVADISLKNLEAAFVCELIAYLTSLELDDCCSLGSVVTKKTHGNPNSVLRFLEIMYQDGLLRYSMGSNRWEWDAEKINNSTTVTNDVGELLAARIKYLPQNSLSVLKLAACIGFSFDKHILEHLAMEDFSWQSSVKSSAQKSIEETQTRDREVFFHIMDESLHAGLLETTDQDSVCRFSHDLIHQNVYAKISLDEKKAIHLRIARLMRSKSYYERSSQNLFIAVNHFNSRLTTIETDDERMHVVELNLQASIAAREGSSFRAAANFLEKAIATLNGEDWSKHYSLLLELFSSAAEVQFSCGDMQKSTTYAKEVIRNARCTEDQIRGHFINVDILGRERRYSQALAEGFRILDILGCNIPRYMIRVYLYKDLAKIKKKVWGKTTDSFLEMKPMTNVVHVSSLRLMDTMTRFLALQGDESMAALLLTRMMLMTLDNGHSIYSPYSFASYGILLYYLGDAEGGHRYGTLGLRIAEMLGSKRALTRTAFIFYTYLNHLKKPLTNGIEPMLNAHRMGLQVGDVEHSSICLCTYSNLYVAVGLPLEPYMEDMKQFCEQLELYHQNQAIALMAPFRQLALNLMGLSENPLVLSGDAMHLGEFYRRFTMSGESDNCNQDVTYFNLKYATLMLSYIFQDMDEMEKWFRHKPTKSGLIATSHFDNLYVSLFSGLAAFSLHRATGKLKYYLKAQKELSAMKAFTRTCGINAVPLRRLLIAEKQRLSKDRQRTLKCYDESISTFARCGLIHLEAIACERAGDYMASVSDTFWSQSYYSRSQIRYMEWGATAKADQMNACYQLQTVEFKSRDDGTASSTTGAYASLRGKRRYDPATWRTIAKADIVDHQGRSSLITGIER